MTAYEMIGRLVVEWGAVEQLVIRKLWSQQRRGPFAPPTDRSFWKRWVQFEGIVAKRFDEQQELSWSDLVVAVAHLVEFRNSLAHWTFEVREGGGRYSVAVAPHEILEWRKAFGQWWSRWKDHPFQTRLPPPPSGRVRDYQDYELEAVLTRMEDVRAIIQALADDLPLAPLDQHFSRVAGNPSMPR